MSHPAPYNLIFAAHPITGSGRGHKLGTPTINLSLEEIPASLQEGIFACRAQLDDGPLENAVLHYGPRPVFKDTPACEVHLLDRLVEKAPVLVTVHIVKYLREVRDFASVEALQAQIAADITEARAIVAASF